ncbi:SPFH domain-containing protein [Salinibacter ruber]|uniref:SPFH domain-containing protein n=1 Tax=Salinibacter ruber TaxID=146919 RepID=UPI000E58006C|nr:SPFH domain-containing protein [Salinibacter ruber]
MERVQDAAGDIANEVSDKASDELQASIEEGRKKVQGEIEDKLGAMVGMVTDSARETLKEQFRGIDEEEVLRFVPDRRRFAGIGPLLMGLFLLVLLPSVLNVVAYLFFLGGALAFGARYVLNAKVDVPEGYEGVLCRFGEPYENKETRNGRNWLFRFSDYIPYLVSKRDQVVDMHNANFTADYASIGISSQIVFQVVDAKKFIANTTPAGIMKSLNLYASYIALRIITSVEDARVKFSGRDSLDNIVAALNDHLSDDFGIEVTNVSMPSADNQILEDLEEIRTLLKEIDAMKEKRQVRLESAVKAVESELRTKRKQARRLTPELQQAKISLDTDITELVNEKRQEVLIEARRKLEEGASELDRDLANFRARLKKAISLQNSLEALKRNFELRTSKLKRRAFNLIGPDQVTVLGVSGIGTGVGLGMSKDVVKNILSDGSGPLVDEDPPTQAAG